MPIVDISLLEGRSPEKLKALGAAVTKAVVEAIDAPPEAIKVILHEFPPTHMFEGGASVAVHRKK